MIFYNKYLSLIAGFGFLIVGILSYFRVFTDASKNAGIASIIIGIISIIYHFRLLQKNKKG
ncbi:MAG TPA: hypothetical protein PLG30_11205 [Bacteroidia bacterium]|nr:hypothetical protein [Bacteroidia bacterium]